MVVEVKIAIFAWSMYVVFDAFFELAHIIHLQLKTEQIIFCFIYS